MAFFASIRTRLLGERPDVARLHRASADLRASQDRLAETCRRLDVALRADRAAALRELRAVRAATRRMRAETPIAG